MSIDAELLELLACPSDDHAPLREDDRGRRSRSWCARSARRATRSATAYRCCCSTTRRRDRTASASRPGRDAALMFDEAILDEPRPARPRRDEQRLLWTLATAGAQVRRAVELLPSSAWIASRGQVPRALLIATDAPPSAALRLRDPPELRGDAGAGLARRRTAALGRSHRRAVDRLGRRAASAAGRARGQGARRGLAMAVVAPAGSQVAAAAGRAPLHELPTDLNLRASRWAVLTPLLQAARRAGDPSRAAGATRAGRRRTGRDGRGVPPGRRRVHESGQGARDRVRRHDPADRRRGRARQCRRARDCRCVAALRGCRGGVGEPAGRVGRAGAVLRGGGVAEQATSSATGWTSRPPGGRGCW